MSENDIDRATHPLKRLKKQAEEAEKRQEKEVIYCPECGTEVLKDSVEAAIETAKKHDGERHDGKATTKVNGIVLPQFSDENKAKIQQAVRSLRPETDQEAGGDE